MAQFTIDVPDDLAAGFVADMHASNQGRPDPFQNVQDYVQFSAVALATDRCKAHSVGPNYVGPVLVAAKYNQDGTPIAPPQADEIAPAGDVVTEPVPQTNDTSVPEEGV